jgi:uncharacterized protein YbbC (DUF1343 family)
MCNGLQIHVTDAGIFRPVAATLDILEAVIQTSAAGAVRFNSPPYEYEYKLMPFDILSGDDKMRKVLESGSSIKEEKERWDSGIEEFRKEFRDLVLYED